MKTIIAGSAALTEADMPLLIDSIDACGWAITGVVTGADKGVAQLTEQWAVQNGLPISLFPVGSPPGGMLGLGRVLRRNVVMVNESGAGGLVILGEADADGARLLLHQARKKGLRVHVEQAVDK